MRLRVAAASGVAWLGLAWTRRRLIWLGRSKSDWSCWRLSQALRGSRWPPARLKVERKSLLAGADLETVTERMFSFRPRRARAASLGASSGAGRLKRRPLAAEGSWRPREVASSELMMDWFWGTGWRSARAEIWTPAVRAELSAVAAPPRSVMPGVMDSKEFLKSGWLAMRWARDSLRKRGETRAWSTKSRRRLARSWREARTLSPTMRAPVRTAVATAMPRATARLAARWWRRVLRSSFARVMGVGEVCSTR